MRWVLLPKRAHSHTTSVQTVSELLVGIKLHLSGTLLRHIYLCAFGIHVHACTHVYDPTYVHVCTHVYIYAPYKQKI